MMEKLVSSLRLSSKVSRDDSNLLYWQEEIFLHHKKTVDQRNKS